MNFDAGFVRLASNVHRQRRFLTRTIRRLGGGAAAAADSGKDQKHDDDDNHDEEEDEEDGEEEDEEEEEETEEVVQVDAGAVCRELHECREYLARPHTLRVNVALDTAVPPPGDLIGLWAAHFRPTPLFGRSNIDERSASSSAESALSQKQPQQPQLTVPFSHGRRAAGRHHCAVVLSNAAIESAYLYQSCWFDAGWSNADGGLAHAIACDRVLIEYLTTIEGPFWKRIRGAGLAYGYSLWQSRETGLLTFSLYRATDPVAAHAVARTVIGEFVANGAAAFDAVGIHVRLAIRAATIALNN